MRTNYVLIDYENLQPEDLHLLRSEHFQVLVFVGVNQKNIPIETVTAMQDKGSQARYIRITDCRKNALDFHLTYYIGEIAASDPKGFFHIISKDKGYDPLLMHLKGKKTLAARVEKIADIPAVKAGIVKTPADRASLFISKLNQPKSTKPSTVKTLSNAIAVFFQRQLNDADVSAVIEAIKKDGYITVSDGKVEYAPAATTSCNRGEKAALACSR